MKNEAIERSIKGAVFVGFSVILTVVGFLFSATQVHFSDWRGIAAILLLLPFAAINRALHLVWGPEPLSSGVYRVSFLVSGVGQLFYYYFLLVSGRHILKRLAAFVRPKEM